MSQSINGVLQNLQNTDSKHFRLYQLAVWLNNHSDEYLPLEDDESTHKNFIVEVQKIDSSESFVALVTRFELCDLNQDSEIDGATLKDVALGLSARYLEF